MRISFKLQNSLKKSWFLYSSVFDFIMGIFYSIFVTPIDWAMERLQSFAKRSQTDKRLRKKLVMVINAISGAIFTGLTIWLAVQDTSSSILDNKIFWILILSWAYIALVLFLNKWADMKDKTTDEKIDELTTSVNTLINEIRQDRNERNNKPKP